MARPKQLWIALGGALAAGAVVGAALARAARRQSSTPDLDAPTAGAPQPGVASPVVVGQPQPPASESLGERSGSPAPRAFRLGRAEPVGEGMRRIVLGRLDHALEELREGDDRAVAVHEARKDLKKMRAVLRLLRAGLGPQLYRRENGAFRDTGRTLSGARDAQVRLDTLAALVEAGEVDGESVAVFGARLAAERDAVGWREVPDEQAAAEIEDARGRIRAWAIGDDGWSLVEAGLRRSYRRGRARMRDAVAAPTTDNLHEWRKRVKDLWYHLRILSPAWPAVLEALSEEAHVLSEQLGDDHDLAVMAASAREHFDAFPDPGDLDALLDAVEHRRAYLQRDAFSLGRRLYADRTNAFATRVETWWRAWRPDAELRGGCAAASEAL